MRKSYSISGSTGDTNEKNKAKQATELFLEYREVVRCVALLHAPQPTLADDIVQDTFLAFVRRAEQLDLTSDVRPLLRKIAKDTANMYWREHLRKIPPHLIKLAEILQSGISERMTVIGLAESEDELSALRLCLNKLNRRGRDLIERHYFRKIPLTQIAKETGTNLNTLYSLIDRIRIILRACVENTLKTEVPDV